MANRIARFVCAEFSHVMTQSGHKVTWLVPENRGREYLACRALLAVAPCIPAFTLTPRPLHVYRKVRNGSHLEMLWRAYYMYDSMYSGVQHRSSRTGEAHAH